MSNDTYSILFWTLFIEQFKKNKHSDNTEILIKFLGELSVERPDLYESTENFSLVINTWGIRFTQGSTDVTKPCFRFEMANRYNIGKRRDKNVFPKTPTTILLSLNDNKEFSKFILKHHNNNPVIYDRESLAEDYAAYKEMTRVFDED